MYTLFIDTHDRDLIIALYKDDEVISKKIKESLRNHSDFTMPLIKEILDENEIKVNDLGQIYVVNGPGSFTGVRIGVTIAKTLAYCLNIPIKTITSLEMYALGANIDDNKIVTIKDVKGVFAGLFNNENELQGELFYKDNNEFQEYLKIHSEATLVEEQNVDLIAINEYMKKQEATIAHKVNPIYIKVIEALKND